MTAVTVREAIHERLDPVIEEIVTREISQRGGYGPGLEAQAPFQALMPVLLSTLLQRRPAGAEPQQILQNILPASPLLLQSLTRRPAGAQPQQVLQNILPILPALLPLLMQRRPAGAEPQPILQNILPILPALLPLIMQPPSAQAGLQPQQQTWQAVAPALVAALSAVC